MSSPTFNGTVEYYRDLIDTMVIRPELEGDIQWYVDRILANAERYKAIEGLTHVPWYWIGAVHGRESSFNFSGHLHNGDPLTGRTYRVPAGRLPDIPPPYTFEQSAEDALEMKDLHNVPDWSAERMAYEFERYNGFGYMLYRDINSPYLWSGTNHYTKGKYVADGKYDPNAVDKQMGTMAMIYQLSKQAPIDVHRHGEQAQPVPAPPPPRPAPPVQTPWPPFEIPRQWQPPPATAPAPTPRPPFSSEVGTAIEDKITDTIKRADVWNWVPKLFAVGIVGGVAYTTASNVAAPFQEFVEDFSLLVRWGMIFTATCSFILGICATRITQIIWKDDDK